MSLYTPPWFNAQSSDDVRALMHAAPFATLITSRAAGEPHITHLPLLLEGDVLSGHMARANPHWQAFAEGCTVAVFHGPHAYISPRWYVAPEREVPTWNYATVHVQGQPRLLESAAERLVMVDATSAVFEPIEQPWQRQLPAERLQHLLDAIVAFEIPLTHIEAKFKMNQNKSAADRSLVMQALRASGLPEHAAVADWMQNHEPH